MAYSSLSMPTIGSDPDFNGTVEWIAQAAEAVNGAAQGFLTDLAGLTDIDFSDVGDLPALNSVVWLGGALGLTAPPARPNVQVQNFQSLLDRLNALQPPATPVVTFTYTDPGYASILREPMIQKLLNDLLNGGYGIEPADEEALWNRMRDREVAVLNANLDEVKRQSASSSFPLPQGSLQKAIARAQQEHMAKLSSMSRDIALKRSELYVENRKFTIEKVLESETQSIALYNAIQNRTLESAKVKVEMAIALFDAGIRIFRQMQEALIAQIEAPIRVAQMQVSLYAAETQAYAAFVNSVVGAAQIDIANSRNQLDKDIAENRSRVEIMRFRLQQLVATVEKDRDIYKYGVDYFRTALGSAMNAINGVATQTKEVE